MEAIARPKQATQARERKDFTEGRVVVMIDPVHPRPCYELNAKEWHASR